MMLIPGDLPVFLKLALDICSRQNPEHLVETLVIPDKTLPGFKQLLNQWSKDYHTSSIRLVALNPVEQSITKLQNNPHTNCWLQMVRGIEAVKTQYALWHDADLFIKDANFLKTHYEACVQSQFDCFGVNKVWDQWYEAQNLNHITATWEIMLRVDWVKRFKPWEHRGHDGFVLGQPHTFDITLWPQCQTAPERIGRNQQDWEFVHFNYVIGTYRWFQRSKGSFEDENFRILLIRLLIDAFDSSSGWKYDIPTLVELKKGLSDRGARVTYLSDKTKEKYAEFGLKLTSLLESGLLNAKEESAIKNGVSDFDEVFN
ncbi:MAG: hypothetical protein HC873_14725 [Leptolyngbyaceae cyanobacterium SL_1_1]|nr:hypothetical protein [Leptolyngbyaceae cyanobacterium SL_1_1]